MRIWMGLFFVFFVCGVNYADIVHLKNGRSIPDAEIISEGDTVSFKVKGATLNLPASIIKRIERSAEPEPSFELSAKSKRFLAKIEKNILNNPLCRQRLKPSVNARKICGMKTGVTRTHVPKL